MTRLSLVMTAALLSLTSYAHACADGPDAFRVVDVAADDVLNIRSGPGLKFSVIGELPPDATGVRNLDQVPLNACDSAEGLNAYERRNIWTKVLWEEGDNYVVGWAKSRFLSE